MAEKLASTSAKRDGNQNVTTKLSNEANDLLQVEPTNKQRLEFIEMSELLEVIQQEVEAREISEGVKTNINLEKVNPKQQRAPTVNALLSQDGMQTSLGIQVKCA